MPRAIDVKAIRRRAGLTQPAFAASYGFSVAAVRDWEQGRRRPGGQRPRPAHGHRQESQGGRGSADGGLSVKAASIAMRILNPAEQRVPLRRRDPAYRAPAPSGASVRDRLGLSQTQFAARFHLPVGTPRD